MGGTTSGGHEQLNIEDILIVLSFIAGMLFLDIMSWVPSMILGKIIHPEIYYNATIFQVIEIIASWALGFLVIFLLLSNRRSNSE